MRVKGVKNNDNRFHDLRHTFATRLAQSGVDIHTKIRLNFMFLSRQRGC